MVLVSLLRELLMKAVVDIHDRTRQERTKVKYASTTAVAFATATATTSMHQHLSYTELVHQ